MGVEATTFWTRTDRVTILWWGAGDCAMLGKRPEAGFWFQKQQLEVGAMRKTAWIPLTPQFRDGGN